MAKEESPRKVPPPSLSPTQSGVVPSPSPGPSLPGISDELREDEPPTLSQPPRQPPSVAQLGGGGSDDPPTIGWPSQDRVVAYKNYLKRVAGGEHPRDKAAEEAIAALRKEDPQWQTYPYTKGPDLANDGVGYGEAVSVTLHSRPSGAGQSKPATLEPRRFRRTRSGRADLPVRSIPVQTDPPVTSIPGKGPKAH